MNQNKAYNIWWYPSFSDYHIQNSFYISFCFIFFSVKMYGTHILTLLKKFINMTEERLKSCKKVFEKTKNIPINNSNQIINRKLFKQF